MAVHVFTGPTLSRDAVGEIVPEAILHPPVAHGDLLRIAWNRGDVAVLVDGYYHQSAAVRHKEILWLIDSGARVVGCSSMGALRAAELHRFGMVGNGTVFRMYRDGELDADDEVSVVHTPAPDYEPLGEPLVTIRHVVGAACRRGVISAADADAIVAIARDLNYTVRGWRAIDSVASRDHPHLMGALSKLRKFRSTEGDRLDVKVLDAKDTLSRIDELVADEATEPHGWEPDNPFLSEWLVENTGETVGDVRVNDGEVLRYQQIHREDFPGRWRRFALGHVAGASADEPAEAVEERALGVAARHGIAGGAVTALQEREWLTSGEQRGLTDRQKVLLLLTRSYQQPRYAHALVKDQPDLVANPDARAAVAQAVAINREVETWDSDYGTAHLRHEILLDHLAGLWRVEDRDRVVLLAAARDRGFGSLEKAADAVRPFYLRARFQSEREAAAAAGRGGRGR